MEEMESNEKHVNGDAHQSSHNEKEVPANTGRNSQVDERGLDKEKVQGRDSEEIASPTLANVPAVSSLTEDKSHQSSTDAIDKPSLDTEGVKESDQVVSEVANDETVQSDTDEGLQKLLDLLNISSVYYVDDDNETGIPFETFSAAVKDASAMGLTEQLNELEVDEFSQGLPIEFAIDSFREKWPGIPEEQQHSLLKRVIEITGKKEYEIGNATSRLQQFFSKGQLKALSPNEWTKEKATLTFKNEEEKFLLLFDQDLSKAGGEFAKINGEALIAEMRRSANKERLICTLLSNLIDDVNGELAFRKTITDKQEAGLHKDDFFALTKKRLDDKGLFCDGIKKVLLNKFCEHIKDKSVEVMEEAYSNVINRVNGMETYDFDSTVLRSSYNEGIWEMETLFRISKNLYESEVKKIMIQKNYPEEVNKEIKKAKELSDVGFEIPLEAQSKSEKFQLRHQDIYEAGDVINRLHLPLENGDIFQITDGTGKGHYYILVAQECDLMMRTNPIGKRTANFITLLRIRQLSLSDLNKERNDHFTSGKEEGAPFFSNKFRLDYFVAGTDDTALVKFGDPLIADLDVLDLAVFDSQGNTTMNITDSFNVDLVSTSWEHRYMKLKETYTKQAAEQQKLLAELSKVDAKLVNAFKQRLYLKLSPVKKVGTSESFKASTFSFGIRRVMRLKSIGAKYLLDKYSKHLSRTAEQHDFAANRT